MVRRMKPLLVGLCLLKPNSGPRNDRLEVLVVFAGFGFVIRRLKPLSDCENLVR